MVVYRYCFSVVDGTLLPGGAVTLTVVHAMAAVGPVMMAHTLSSTVTLPVSSAVSSTKGGIGRYLAGLKLKVHSSIGHFCLEIADLFLQGLNLVDIRVG